jgi:hypothetical protein
MYRAMTWQPWRTRGTQNKNKLRVVTAPGKCISINQLESPVQGLIGQLKGKLTNRWYGAATIFVDHASQLSYLHLQSWVTAEETVKAKKAFEAYSRSHGVIVKHYHADNGHFAESLFMSVVAKSGQTVSFCRVSAHFQNGIAARETDSRPVRTSKETTPTCKSKMAISNQNQSMAICTLQCKWHSEHNCRQRWWELTSQKILSNRSPPEVKMQSHIRVPCLYTQLSPPRWQSNSKMESKSKTWHQPWTFASTCKIRQPGAETWHRISLAAISRAIWWLLWDSQAPFRKWTYLFTVAIHFWTC